MQVAESIEIVRQILGRGDKTQAEERRYRIELQALMDVYEGHGYNESRWNITEGFIYREAWNRATDQARIEGKGVLNQEVHHAHSTRHEQLVSSGSSASEGPVEGTERDHAHQR